MLSPIFPFLLTFFACITCWSINSTMLCEDLTLDDLNNNLSNDIVKYDNTMKDYKYYDDARWNAVNDPIRKLSKIDYLNRKASENMKDAMNILARIRQTESAIQKIESSFVSNVQKQWFEINIPNKKFFEWKS